MITAAFPPTPRPALRAASGADPPAVGVPVNVMSRTRGSSISKLGDLDVAGDELTPQRDSHVFNQLGEPNW